jgi:hypothetical protein
MAVSKSIAVKVILEIERLKTQKNLKIMFANYSLVVLAVAPYEG